MGPAMLEELERAIESAGEREILITGAGDVFSAGLDLDALASASTEDVASLLRAMGRTLRKLFLHPAPTAALVNGHAVAGGCLLAQCCDVRIGVSRPEIRIGMTGVAIGLTYPPFVPAIFRLRIAPPHLETILLGAQRYAPDRALALGLLDEVVDPGQARAVAHQRLAERAQLPRRSYAATKLALREASLRTDEADQERFEREVVPAWTASLARKP